MDQLRTLSENTLGVLFKNYFLTLALLGLILAFALYVYFFRGTIAEYFDGHDKKEIVSSKVEKNTEPAQQQPTA
jgi:hypothetical protein